MLLIKQSRGGKSENSPDDLAHYIMDMTGVLVPSICRGGGGVGGYRAGQVETSLQQPFDGKNIDSV